MSDAFKTNDALARLDRAELREELKKVQAELYLLARKHADNELKQPHLLRECRRYVARVKTHDRALELSELASELLLVASEMTK